LVAIKFTNPKRGVLIHVECRAWAKNIEYDRGDKLGSVRFELLILDSVQEKNFLPEQRAANEEARKSQED